MRALLAALALLTIGCGTEAAAPRAGGGFDPERLGGPCHGQPGGDRQDTGSLLAEPGVWLRVGSLDLGSRSGGSDHRGTYRGEFTRQGGDRAVDRRLPERIEDLEIPHRMAEAVTEALAAGADVSLHARTGYWPRYAEFGLAFRGDEFAFLGECAYEEQTLLMRHDLGADATAKLRAVVGQPSTVTRRTFDRPRGYPAHRRLADAPPAARAGLREGRYTVVAPPGWRMPYHLCAGIRQGWSDCVDLSTDRSRRQGARMWFDPAGDNPLRFWLIDAGLDLSFPVRHESVGVDTALLTSAPGDEPVELLVDLGNPPSAAKYATGTRVLLGAQVAFEVRRR